MTDPQQQLAAELQTYEQQKETLLQAGEGRYVLITGDKVLGVYEEKLEAIAAGHQLLGPGPFLVKKLERIERPVHIFQGRI